MTERLWLAVYSPDQICSFLQRGLVNAEASEDGGEVLFTLKDGSEIRLTIDIRGAGFRWAVAV